MLMMLTQMFTNGQSCNGNKWHSLGENTVGAAARSPAPLEFHRFKSGWDNHPDFILEHSSSMGKELYGLFSLLLKMAQVLLNKVKDPLKGPFALNGAVASAHPHGEELSINHPVTSHDGIEITPNK